MPHDISISSSLPAKFPSRCVLCGADEPGKQIRFTAGARYGAFFFVAWFGKGKGSIQAPACGTCAVSSMGRAWMRFALSAGLAVLTGWFLFAAMKGGGRGLFKLKAILVFVAAMVPPVLWDWLFPPKFTVTFDEESHRTTCHFSDAVYAAEFDALNHPPIPSSLELPEGMQFGDKPPAAPLELPASFKPTPSPTFSSSSGGFNVAESYEDKTNPFRNLEDPRFRK